MGKKKLNSSLIVMNNLNSTKQEEPAIGIGSNKMIENRLISNHGCKKLEMDHVNIPIQDKREYLRQNGSKYLIWILMIIIFLLVNKLYFNFNNLYSNQSAAKSSTSLTYASFKSFQIVNYEHIAFPAFDHDDDNRHKSQVSKLNADSNNNINKQHNINNIEVNNDFNMVIFHEEENSNETEQAHRREAQIAVHLALNMEADGKYDKAEKLYQYALSLDPKNTDALTHYGEFIEKHKKDIVKAEHFYTIALKLQPKHDKASSNRERTLPLVNKIDREMLDKIDLQLKEFYQIPVSNPALKRAKREAYFMHIYHSNAIEGNTLNLQQTRHIVETRMAVNGKSIQEHQEVLGLDAAMRYINETLLYKPFGEITIQDILEIHRRVLGFNDPIEAGKFRQHQVYVGNFVPPHHEHVYQLVSEFINWLNSLQVLTEVHPVQLAALAHYKLAYIHPFYDGNGRSSRLLMNLILMRAGFPPVIIRKQDRLAYYEHLETANKGDIRPFIRFIAKCTERTLNEYILVCNSSNSIESLEELNKLMKQNDDLVINSHVDEDDDDDVEGDKITTIIEPVSTIQYENKLTIES